VKRIALAMVAVLLLLPTAAHAKGTNVRISSAPNGTDVGEPWTTLITITMPGNGRLEGLRPAMIVRRGSEQKAFAAAPTTKRGVYRVQVVFPSRGTWRYGVDDGFDRFERGAGQVHDFPPVTIAADQPEVDDPPLPISGEIEPEVAPPARGQLPPETYVVPTTDEDESNSAMFPALAFLLAAALAGPVWIRRRRQRARDDKRTA
jgi:hypothetical protein